MPRRPIEQTQSQGNLIRAPSRTGSAAACSGQAWISARRPRPAVGVVSLRNCARRRRRRRAGVSSPCSGAGRRGGGARLSDAFIARMTLPAEKCSATRPPRRARIAQCRKTVCSSCGRQKARMGTLLPADATRDKRSMLSTPVALLEGWCRCQSLDIWRQTPCKDLLGRQPGHAEELQRRTRSLVLPDSQLTYKKRPIRPRKQPTRPARRDAVPPACPAWAAATALARPLPLATPPRQRHYWQHPRPRFTLLRSRLVHWSSRRGARPRFGQL